MKTPNPFIQEIVDAHVHIEQWFAGTADPGSLDQLLGRFSKDFEMIATNGDLLDRVTVNKLFSQSYGGRPGLQIQIDELREIAISFDTALLGYRETHIDRSGSRQARRSSALLKRTASNQIVWWHLHETSSLQRSDMQQ